MKIFIIVIFYYIPSLLFSQIKIDDVGDNWKEKITTSLHLIEKIDKEKYDTLMKYCNHITFWSGNFSTTEDSTTIMISQKDMNLNSINNIACVLIHESFHLKNYNKKLNSDKEEILAYKYELEFINKITDVEYWIPSHAIQMIGEYQERLK